MEALILVGAGIDQLNEADTAFSHATGDQTLPGKAGVLAKLETAELERFVDFRREIEDRGHFALHTTIGAVSIQPGDLIAGDHDGVIIIPKAVAAEAIARAEKL